MGCDIHSIAEVRKDGKWQKVENKIFKMGAWLDPLDLSSAPFDNQSYGMFGFLADVRNYSGVPCLTGEQRGYPDDISDKEFTEDSYNHSGNWFTLAELLAWDYAAQFEDLRCTIQTGPRSWNGAGVALPGNGQVTTYAEFLGKSFFDEIEILKTLGAPEDVRIVVSFDN